MDWGEVVKWNCSNGVIVEWTRLAIRLRGLWRVECGFTLVFMDDVRACVSVRLGGPTDWTKSVSRIGGEHTEESRVREGGKGLTTVGLNERDPGHGFWDAIHWMRRWWDENYWAPCGGAVVDFGWRGSGRRPADSQAGRRVFG